MICLALVSKANRHHTLPLSTMTVMQLMIQPFGIMNTLRRKFVIPMSATGALAATVVAPKSTGLYKFCGAWLTNSESNSLAYWTRSLQRVGPYSLRHL